MVEYRLEGEIEVAFLGSKGSQKEENVCLWSLVSMYTIQRIINYSEIFGIYFFGILEGSNNLKEPWSFEERVHSTFLGQVDDFGNIKLF